MIKDYGQDCVIAKTLEIIGERWTMLIVRDLFLGKKTYTEFQLSLKGISPNLLVERLKDLEGAGLIERKILTTRPPRVEYLLTKKGMGLGKVLSSMLEWGSKNFGGDLSSAGLYHRACGHEVELVYHCDHCQRKLMMSELDAKRNLASQSEMPN